MLNPTNLSPTRVTVLEKHMNNSATLHFNSKITSDNRSYGGVYPIVAHESHQQNVAALVNEALHSLPEASPENGLENVVVVKAGETIAIRKKPDFITATRGPGMRASLITGMDTAKGLAVAWQVPILGVNHMQAHALTPRLVSALDASSSGPAISTDPSFPFLTLLVSGGHTMLVHSKALCDHEILANTTDIAIGDMIDKCARDILPPSIIASAPDVMYGPLLESYAFPDNPSKGEASQLTPQTIYNWKIATPYSRSGPKGPTSYLKSFSYSGIGSSVKRILEENPGMDDRERRVLARETMRVAFEHLASRVLLYLQTLELKNIQTLVVSGGVASNQYLKAVLRNSLDMKGHGDMRLVFPPPKFCTDNAAMIAWTGMEMYEAGWRTSL
ncbi:tRNA N6-adenosine threonylcarbamoyltransferase, partial [Lachnellula suecica]